MAIKKVPTNDIVKHLRTIPAVTAIAPGGIFTRILAKDEPNLRDDYIKVRLVSNTNVVTSNNAGVRAYVARIEFKFIGGTDQVTDETVVEMVRTMDDTLLPDGCPKITDFNGFTITHIREGSPFGPDSTALDKPIMIKDYLFSYYA